MVDDIDTAAGPPRLPEPGSHDTLFSRGSAPPLAAPPAGAYLPLMITARLTAIRERIARAAARSGRPPDAVTLVAVTKTFAPGLVRDAWQAGLREFGENRVQEAAAKIPAAAALIAAADAGITWHLIGHLQTNKARLAAELFHLVHSVDSPRVADELDRQAALREARLGVLIEVNTSGEVTKHGVTPQGLARLVDHVLAREALELRGLMTVGPLVSSAEEARPAFRLLARLAADERRRLGARDALPVLSMGMSDDFDVAIEEGATMIRLGRALFGERAG